MGRSDRPRQLAELVDALETGRLSVDATVRRAVESARRDPHNAFISTVSADHAVARLESRSGESPLEGVPLAVKDNICTEHLPTTAGSEILADYRSPFDAPAVRRLREAGMIVVGKTNLDEFAMGSATRTSHVGPTRNPRRPDCIAGGSSGGSAAAVAAGVCPVALGSDTGGSVRQPASHCGVVGLKPTYGRVSRRGLIAHGSSLDQIGVLANSVEGAARTLAIMAGPDVGDETTSNRRAPDRGWGTAPRSEEWTVGVPRQWIEKAERLDPAVDRAVREGLERLARTGATVRSLDLPILREAVAAYYVLSTAEASSNLARYDGIHVGRRAESDGDAEDLRARSRTEGFGEEVQRRIILGTFVLSEGYLADDYGAAQRVRAELRDVLAGAFDEVDLLAGPTAPVPARPLDAPCERPLETYLEDVFTTPANLAGLPAISVPCGESDDGRPIGLQAVAPRFEERRLYDVARRVRPASS